MDAIIRTKTAELNELKEEQKAVEGSLRSWTSKLRDRYEFSILVLFTFKLHSIWFIRDTVKMRESLSLVNDHY